MDKNLNFDFSFKKGFRITNSKCKGQNSKFKIKHRSSPIAHRPSPIAHPTSAIAHPTSHIHPPLTTLLKIRLIQLKRELNLAGFGVIIVFGLLWLLIYASYSTFQKTPDAYYLTAFIFMVCVWIQYARNDKLFVFSHIHKPHLAIYSEYVALTLPFAISSLLTVNWFCYPVLLAGLLVVPFLKQTSKQKTYFKNISAIIPASDFEWISGFRKSFACLIPLYVLAIGFSWLKILPLFLLWFITVTISSFYDEFESLQIVKEGNLRSAKFLRQKLIRHSKYIVLLYSPVIVINTVFNSEYWVLNLLFIPIQLSLLSFAIYLKYSSYEPGKRSIGSNIVLALVSLGSIIPFLLPIPLLMAVVYYGKAKNNLDNYLHD